MLIAYGIHRGGGPGSCDVHTKTSIVNGLTGDFINLNMSECPSSNFDLHFEISIYDVIVPFFLSFFIYVFNSAILADLFIAFCSLLFNIKLFLKSMLLKSEYVGQ